VVSDEVEALFLREFMKSNSLREPRVPEDDPEEAAERCCPSWSFIPQP
jgi:hypothetical protein